MGAIRTLLMALLGAALTAAPAAASEDDWPVLKGARLDGQMPWGAFAAYRATGQVTSGVTLFVRGQELIARRVTTNGGENAQVAWARSAACPALAPALAGLERLPAAQIDVPLAGRVLPQVKPAERGASYFAWVQTAHLGGASAGQLELRADEGAPLAAWMEKTLSALASCWSPRQP